MAESEIQSAPLADKMAMANLSSEKAGRGSDVSSDHEKQVVTGAPELKRKLKSRHLQMIAIGVSSHSLLEKHH